MLNPTKVATKLPSPAVRQEAPPFILCKDAMINKSIEAIDIQRALQDRYNTSKHTIIFEVRNSTGFRVRDRYADAVVVGMYPSEGCLIEGFEIKVARGDLKNELKNPEKSYAIKQYCDKWWLVATSRVIQNFEIPNDWGIMLYKDGALKIYKQAPMLKAKPLSRYFMASCIRNYQRALIQSVMDYAKELKRLCP